MCFFRPSVAEAVQTRPSPRRVLMRRATVLFFFSADSPLLPNESELNVLKGPRQTEPLVATRGGEVPDLPQGQRGRAA